MANDHCNNRKNKQKHKKYKTNKHQKLHKNHLIYMFKQKIQTDLSAFEVNV